MTVAPAHDDLNDPVQLVECDGAWHQHSAPDGGLQVSKLDAQLIDRGGGGGKAASRTGAGNLAVAFQGDNLSMQMIGP